MVESEYRPSHEMSPPQKGAEYIECDSPEIAACFGVGAPVLTVPTN